MKYRGIFEYESTEHEPPVSIDVYLHDDCVKGKIIEWEYRPLEQESKTGHWIYICNSEVNGLKIVECSECGKRTYGSGKYCPNCGCMMKSEDQG